VKQALVSKQRGSCQKKCCFSRTMPARTQLPSQSLSWLICLNILCIHLIWPLVAQL
jgi:hypothetical protein